MVFGEEDRNLERDPVGRFQKFKRELANFNYQMFGAARLVNTIFRDVAYAWTSDAQKIVVSIKLAPGNMFRHYEKMIKKMEERIERVREKFISRTHSEEYWEINPRYTHLRK